MDHFADDNITAEQALHDSMDCLRMAEKALMDKGQVALAIVLKVQAEKNLRILTGAA